MKEQGIQDPIKGGDIRDKWDQYKGVGVSLDDPYENYRRNKSYNFVAEKSFIFIMGFSCFSRLCLCRFTPP